MKPTEDMTADPFARPDRSAGRRKDNDDAMMHLIVSGICMLLLVLCLVGMGVVILDTPELREAALESGFAVLGALLYLWAYVVWIGVTALCAFLLSSVGLLFSVKAIRRAEKRGARITAWIFTGLHGVVCFPCAVVLLILLVGLFT